MAKKILVSLFILYALQIWAFTIHDTKMEFYFKYDSHFQYYHNVKLNFQIFPYDKFEIETGICNNLKTFDSLDDLKILAWNISLYYILSDQFYLGTGDRFLNLSPYLLHQEEWQDNTFKGLFLHYYNPRFEINMDGFIGMHAEDTNKLKFNGQFLKTDIGYINKYYINKIQTTSPSIWGTFSLKKVWSKFFSNKLIYVRENYTLEKPNNGFSSYYFFYNDIFQLNSDLSLYDKLKFEVIPLFMRRDFQKFNGAGDYYGPGKHKLIFDYESTENIVSGVFSVSVTNLFHSLFQKFYCQFSYQYMGKNFLPVYMDNGRLYFGRDEFFLNDIYAEAKGYKLNVVVPLLANVYLGVNYFSYDSLLNSKQYAEKRFYLQYNINNKVVLLVLFRQQNGYLNDYGSIKMEGFFIKCSGKINKHISLTVQYNENEHYGTKENSILCKTDVRF